MTNLYWYLLLAFIGIGVNVFAIYIKKDTYKVSALIVFYLFAASITWIGEFVVLGLFNSYRYKTGVFENIWLQNLLGHLILNTTIYPAAAIAMVAFSLYFGWIALVAALFAVAEYSFIKMGIYEQHWWRYYLTTLVVIIFLIFSRYWFNKMIKKPYGFIRTVTFYFVAMLIIHAPSPVLLLLGKQYYQLSWVDNIFGDRYLSSIVIVFCYHLVEAFLIVLFTCILKKWYWKVAPFIISLAAQIAFSRVNILVMQGWKLVYTILIYEVFILAFMLLEKYSLRPDFK